MLSERSEDLLKAIYELQQERADERISTLEFPRFGGQFRTNRLGCKGILHLVSHR